MNNKEFYSIIENKQQFKQVIYIRSFVFLNRDRHFDYHWASTLTVSYHNQELNHKNSFVPPIDRCHSNERCDVEASYDEFQDDPCEGTPKVLEIEYYCASLGKPTHGVTQSSPIYDAASKPDSRPSSFLSTPRLLRV